METVNAPTGYEGSLYYDDGTRSWKVSYRAVGDTWWTLCYHDAGHAHTHADERKTRAEASIVHALTVRGLLKSST